MKYTDEEIIQGLRNVDYKIWEDRLFHQFKYFVNTHKDKKEKLEFLQEAYADAIMDFINNIHNGKFEERSKISTYLKRIFSNKYIDGIRKISAKKNIMNKTIDLDQIHGLTEKAKTNLEDELEYLEGKKKRLWMILGRINPRCKELVITRYVHGIGAKEVAVLLGFTSDSSVRVTTKRCLDSIRSLMDKI